MIGWIFTPHLLTFIFWGTFVVGLLAFRHNKRDKYVEGWVKVQYGPQRTFWYSLATAAAAWGVASVIAILLGTTAVQTQKTWEYRDQPLVSLRTADSMSISGSVFVVLGFGGGDVEGTYEPVYVYYIEDNGAIVQRHLTGEVRIYEEDRPDGVLRTNWLRIDKHVDTGNNWFYQYIAVAGKDHTMWQQGTQEFRVPRGSVSRQIVIR